MKKQQFKTTIKCAACLAKVTPTLNEVVGEDKWSVDIQNPAKILTLENEVQEVALKDALEKIGYKAERLV